MQKKIGKNQIRRRGLPGPFEGFGADDRGQPVLATQLIKTGVGNGRLGIHQKEAASPSARRKGQGKNAGQEVSVAGAEVDQAGGGAVRVLSAEPMEPQFFLAKN